MYIPLSCFNLFLFWKYFFYHLSFIFYVKIENGNFNGNDTTMNEFNFQKPLTTQRNNTGEHDYAGDDKKNVSNSFFPPLH